MDSKWDNSWPLKPRKQLTHDDYTIAWLCALPIEIQAAENMLDEAHEPPPHPEADDNIYLFGSICRHNVVIGWPSEMGIAAVTRMAIHIERTFRNLKFGLMVGIAAGVPENGDARLGDVVVSKRDGFSGGVILHDRGKVTTEGSVHQSYLNGVPDMLAKATQRLGSLPRSMMRTYLTASYNRNSDFYDFERPIDLADILFESDYNHVDPKDKQCLKCDKERAVKSRPERRKKKESVVLLGTVASGNQVIKASEKRAEIAEMNPGILAIEMEAAGLMDVFGCATIRGICDYADSHKNDGWHKYAAAAAAAVAKELLGIVPVTARSTVVPIADPTPVRSSGNKHFLVPRQVNPNFTGRDEILKALKDQLCPLNYDEQTSETQRRSVIRGIGGCGKSEVCLKFAERNRNLFWGIFWIDCTSIKSIKESFANISRRCGLGEDFEQAKIWLENAKDSWLLILDNADDPDIDYYKYLPSGNRGYILMSTRNPKCEEFSTVGDEIFQMADFEKLEFEDAVTLLLKSSGVKKDLWDKQRFDAEKVVRILEQHALAIVNAGAYIKEKFCTLVEYPSEFEKQCKLLLKHCPEQARSTYGDVYATFAVSTEKIRERASTDPDYHFALELFDVLGYMHFNGVTPEIWERAFHTSEDATFFVDDDDDDDIDYLSNWHKSYFQSFLRSRKGTLSRKQLLRKGLNVLVSFSLVNEQDGSGIVAMHPLAHAWARDRLKPEDAVKAWTRTAIILTLASGSLSYDIFWRQLKLHIGSCVQRLLKDELSTVIWSTNPRIQTVKIIYRICSILLWEDEEATAFEGFKLIQKHLNPVKGSLNWMRLQNWIAACIGCLGNPWQELLLLEEIDVYSNTIDDVMFRWELKRFLGRAYTENKQYEKASRVLKKVYYEQKAELDSADPDFMDTLTNLAFNYDETGKYRKAIRLRENLVKIRADSLDRSHPELLVVKHNLGATYLKCGMNDAAVEILTEVVEIRTEVLELTNANLLISQDELSRAYAALGAHDKAIEIMQKVVEVEKKILASTDNSRLLRQRLLAEFYIDTGSYSQAISILEEVTRAEKQVEESWETQYSQTLLGRAYLRHGMYAKAVDILEAVHEIDKKKYSLYNIECLKTRWDLAVSYWELSRKKDAMKLLEEIVPVLAEAYDPSTPVRQDFERLLERFQADLDEPLGSEFVEHQEWRKPKQLDDGSDSSSISSMEDESDEDDARIPQSTHKKRWWKKNRLDRKGAKGGRADSKDVTREQSMAESSKAGKNIGIKGFFSRTRRR